MRLNRSCEIGFYRNITHTKERTEAFKSLFQFKEKEWNDKMVVVADVALKMESKEM